MDSGAGTCLKFQSHLIPISRIQGHAKIFIFLSMLLLFSGVTMLARCHNAFHA